MVFWPIISAKTVTFSKVNITVTRGFKSILNVELYNLLVIGKRKSCVRGSGEYRVLNQKMQKYNNFLILDFESTCEKNVKIKPQEIIEFPCLWMSSRNFEVISTFHQYVKPKFQPVLTTFCTELTGIIQETVESEPHFDSVFKNFLSWVEDTHNKVGKEENFIFVTCGDWDLKVMLPEQCELLNIPIPDFMKKWINIKKEFARIKARFPNGIMDMSKQLNLSHIGRLHSGIDDCKNIANILKQLANEGAVFNQTSAL